MSNRGTCFGVDEKGRVVFAANFGPESLSRRTAEYAVRCVGHRPRCYMRGDPDLSHHFKAMMSDSEGTK